MNSNPHRRQEYVPSRFWKMMLRPLQRGHLNHAPNALAGRDFLIGRLRCSFLSATLSPFRMTLSVTVLGIIRRRLPTGPYPNTLLLVGYLFPDVLASMAQLFRALNVVQALGVTFQLGQQLLGVE
jgi:hypothetical protein